MANPGIHEYHELVAQGRELINAGAYDQAANLLSQATSQMEDEAPAHAWLAYALSKMTRHEEALGSWQRARSIDDELLEEEQLALQYAHSLAELGRYGDAAEVHGRLLARGVSTRYRASVLVTMGDLLIAGSCDAVDEAIELFLDVVRDYPDEPGGHWRLAAALYRAGRADEGDSELAVALRLDPQWGAFSQSGFVIYPAYDVHLFRALGWEHLGHDEQARREWQRYLDAGGGQGCWADMARSHMEGLESGPRGRAR